MASSRPCRPGPGNPGSAVAGARSSAEPTVRGAAGRRGQATARPPPAVPPATRVRPVSRQRLPAIRHLGLFEPGQAARANAGAHQLAPGVARPQRLAVEAQRVLLLGDLEDLADLTAKAPVWPAHPAPVAHPA